MNAGKCILCMMVAVIVFGGAALLFSEVFHWDYAALISLLGLPVIFILWNIGIQAKG